MIVKFLNTDLQSINSTAEKSISSHLAKLDQVSNDIKALENMLSKAGISINFMYLFEEEHDKGHVQLNEFDSIKTHLEILHYMVWNRDKQRLLYEIHTIHREIVEAEEHYRQWKPDVFTSKPLIETKAHIRLKVQPELQFFYNQIIGLLGQGHVQERVIERSPNLDLIPF